eukprot:scaffold433_cov257-Pinguiococcus_pyrenoidosus.AAC.9
MESVRHPWQPPTPPALRPQGIGLGLVNEISFISYSCGLAFCVAQRNLQLRILPPQQIEDRVSFPVPLFRVVAKLIPAAFGLPSFFAHLVSKTDFKSDPRTLLLCGGLSFSPGQRAFQIFESQVEVQNLPFAEVKNLLLPPRKPDAIVLEATEQQASFRGEPETLVYQSIFPQMLQNQFRFLSAKCKRRVRSASGGRQDLRLLVL